MILYVELQVPFFNQHTEEFRKMWGGFPPGSDGDLVCMLCGVLQYVF